MSGSFRHCQSCLVGIPLLVVCTVAPLWFLGYFHVTHKKGVKVNEKVVVVTGAGSGIGRALTLELVKRGAKVAAVDMRPVSLHETKMIAGYINVETFVMDVTNTTQMTTLPEKIRESLGETDILVNNAGIIQPFVNVKDLTIEKAMKVMDVNFNAPLFLIKTFLPDLLKRPQGYILNISSMCAYLPVPGQSVYGASKAALKMLTESLRSELAETNVGITVVFPGSIETNIMENSGATVPSYSTDVQEKFKRLPADVAAKTIVDAIESGNPRVTVGNDATFLDYFCRFHPVYAADYIYQQMKNLL